MTVGRIFFHFTKYFVLGVTKYSLKIMYMLEKYSKKIQSYSLVHFHLFMFMFIGS
jgi:hypothetical protein